MATSASDEPPAACERRVKQRARELAIDRLGREVMTAFFDLQSHVDGVDHQTVSLYALHLQQVLVALDFEPADLRSEVGPTGVSCTLHAKARFLGVGRPDPAFRFEHVGLDRPAYFEGDEATLGVAVSRDAFVYVLNVDAQENVTLLVPNDVTGAVMRLKQGERLTFPDAGARARGIRLVAALPEGVDATVEVLHIIAARDLPDLFVPGDARGQQLGPYTAWQLGRMDGVLRRLAAVDRSRWTMAIVPFNIRRRP